MYGNTATEARGTADGVAPPPGFRSGPALTSPGGHPIAIRQDPGALYTVRAGSTEGISCARIAEIESGNEPSLISSIIAALAAALSVAEPWLRYAYAKQLK